jgi:ABC-type multidrug transport system fused ATPase/permease subunit
MLMTSSIGGVTAPLSAAARAAGAATIFYTIIDAKTPDTSGVKDPEASASEDIVLQNVNFAYPTRPNAKILDDLSVTFPAGKITAIVGPSGSGKSTIVALLERWYELDGDMDKNVIVSHASSFSVLTWIITPNLHVYPRPYVYAMAPSRLEGEISRTLI